MNAIAAQEIKRRGIGAVDELLAQGPVHVITHNEPRYVVMDEARYAQMQAALYEAALARALAVQADIAAGDALRFDSVAALMAAIDAAGGR